MRLEPLQTPSTLELAAHWLSQEENNQWLDLGADRRIVSPALLKLLGQKGTHFLRSFMPDGSRIPIGVIGLNDIDHRSKTGTLWAVLGEKSHARRGHTTRACSMLLTLAFEQLGLHSVNTWIVEHNHSVAIARRLNFRYAGRLRHRHCIDGRYYDRLLFDLLAAEHSEWHRA